ncbi:hypothetical protein BKA64DRAFT_647769 [Cadophora sp. MPI-SDFR-AT-0126]|nr:hypothetical protein BKA64DRAFT_647769 [Leotiomycetes sp. MPI-SDFR-AT-0126]
MLNDNPSTGKASSFNFFKRFVRFCPGRISRIIIANPTPAQRIHSRRTSRDGNNTNTITSPTNQTPSESQIELNSSFPEHPSYPPTTASLITALHVSLLATPAEDRLTHIELLQKLLHTLTFPNSKSNSNNDTNATTDPLSTTALSSPSFHQKAYTYLTKTHKTDNLSVAYIRETTCAYCFIDSSDHKPKLDSNSNSQATSCHSTRPNPSDQEQKTVLFLSELECALLGVEGWTRGDRCWCGGVEKREKERKERVEKERLERVERAERAERLRVEGVERRKQISGEGRMMERETEKGREKVKEKERQIIRDWTMNGSAKMEGPASGDSNAAHNENVKKDVQRRASEPGTATPTTPPTTSQPPDSAPNSPTSLKTRLITFPVPRNYALKPYESEQKPGLDGYSADQEREERFGEEYNRYLARVQEERERDARMRERDLERASMIGMNNQGERGRRRETTGYGVPYNNNPPQISAIVTGGYGSGTIPCPPRPRFINPNTGMPIPRDVVVSRSAQQNGAYAASYDRNCNRETPRTRELDRYVGTGTGTSSYISASRSASYAGTGTGAGRSSLSSSYIAPTPSSPPPTSGATSDSTLYSSANSSSE